MIQFTQDLSQPDWHGYLYAVLLFLAAVIQSLFLHQYFHRCMVIGMNMRSSIIAAVYNKVCYAHTHKHAHTCTLSPVYHPTSKK